MASLIPPGALETAVDAGGADDGRVAEAARLIVRAERVASVRFYVTSHARLLPLIADNPEEVDPETSVGSFTLSTPIHANPNSNATARASV